MKPCKVDGCNRRVRKQGLCFGHVRRGEGAEIAPRVKKALRDAGTEKLCVACNEWLPVDRFTKDSRSADGHRYLCLTCHTNRRRMAKFGVSADWFEQTLAAQGGRCAICRGDQPRGRGWAIDHDHQCCPDKATSCGSCVRAILCNPCNLALGLLGDRVDVIEAAAAYVASHTRMSVVRGV